jgi:hypothetical protein
VFHTFQHVYSFENVTKPCVHLKLTKCKVPSLMAVQNKYYLYVVLTKNKIRHINITQQPECTLNNEINEEMVILEKIRKKVSNLD